MKTIELTQGKVTIVDDDVYEWASKFKWYAKKYRSGFYAARNSLKSLGKQRTILLHREIMEPGAGLEVDHREGGTLDNRRENLRNVTHQQNMWAYQRSRRADASSKFRGVCRHNQTERWQATIGHAGRQHYLGCFTFQTAAAKAYDAAAIKFYGEYAQLNFPLTKTI